MSAERLGSLVPLPEAWLVINGSGNRSVHLDHTLADAYAAKGRGVTHALVLATDFQRMLAEAYARGLAAGKELTPC